MGVGNSHAAGRGKFTAHCMVNFTNFTSTHQGELLLVRNGAHLQLLCQDEVVVDELLLGRKKGNREFLARQSAVTHFGVM